MLGELGAYERETFEVVVLGTLPVADREALAAPEEFGMLPDGRLLLLQRGPREGEIDRFDVVLHFDRILEERLP